MSLLLLLQHRLAELLPRPRIPPRASLTLQFIDAGSRPECCATCRYTSNCPLVAQARPADQTSSTCAGWDLAPVPGQVHPIYLALMARQRRQAGL